MKEKKRSQPDNSRRKAKSVWVLVEAVEMFRTRYIVETPAEHPEYALDTVVLEEAKLTSSEYLGETIVGHRVVNEEEALSTCDRDNDYAKDWDENEKKREFFTRDEKPNTP